VSILNTIDALAPHRTSGGAAQEGIAWSDYATQYDLMTEMIPVYDENIARLRALVAERGLAGAVSVCDLGAGTGNYISALADVLPEARFTHVDFDPQMSAIARAKYRKRGIEVTMIQDYMQRAEFPAGSFDLIICVNALYAAAPQELVLQRVKSWLRPGGIFFVIDFGRKQRVVDWGWYILKSSLKQRAVRKLASFVLNARHVVGSARRGAKYQTKGGYWLHTTHEFGHTLSDAGFIVDELEPCYRGYADLAVCRRSDAPER
jgi:ubiquinone/menaquinone biosynthesis C-methylase UbiE